MVESPKGKEIVALHDNGFKLAETQKDMTPIQKYVYFKARDYHFGDDKPSMSQNNMNKLQQLK